MRILVCLGFLLAATAASAHPYVTEANREVNSLAFTGPGAAAMIGQIVTPPTGSSATMTIARYQPTGAGGYRPMGSGGYRPMGAGGYRPTGR
jgi:hypothetical protein